MMVLNRKTCLIYMFTCCLLTISFAQEKFTDNLSKLETLYEQGKAQNLFDESELILKNLDKNNPAFSETSRLHGMAASELGLWEDARNSLDSAYIDSSEWRGARAVRTQALFHMNKSGEFINEGMIVWEKILIIM